MRSNIIMKKEFLDVPTIRDDAILLADEMVEDGFIPNVIYVGLRGGTTMGNVISEYFKLIAPVKSPPLYAAVVAHSYEGLESTQKIHIDGWTYKPEFLRKSDKILFVDDIFDSGFTINAIVPLILEQGINKDNFRIAVHDYKERTFKQDKHRFVPHYYSRKIIIERAEDDNWIHYLSHELDGLSDAELKIHYSDRVQNSLQKILAIRAKNLSQ